MPKMVFIGQQPNSYDDQGTALPFNPGTSGKMLVQMMGVTNEAFAQNFVRMNVSAHHEPEGFSPAYSQYCAKNFLPLLEGRRVVLLGPAVAEAFDIERKSYDWCSWFDHPTEHALFAVIPHPSGRNRLYNNPEIHEMVRSFLDGCWLLK